MENTFFSISKPCYCINEYNRKQSQTISAQCWVLIILIKLILLHFDIKIVYFNHLINSF